MTTQPQCASQCGLGEFIDAQEAKKREAASDKKMNSQMPGWQEAPSPESTMHKFQLLLCLKT